MGIRRFIALIICFPLLIFPAILAGKQPEAHPYDICARKKCSTDGPVVRFPFVLQGKQPEHCGYNSSYNLYCDEMNHTIFELPSSSVKFLVTNIDYLSQIMQIQFLENCFAKQLRDLDVSTTPFQYSMSEYYSYSYSEQFTLFNCSSSRENSFSWIHVQCLDKHGYKVYATFGSDKISYLAELLESCTKMYDTKSVPQEIFDQDFMYLKWSFPQCQKCEVRRGECRWNGSSSEFSCLGGKTDPSEILKKLRISGPILGCLLLLPTIGAIFYGYSEMEQYKENQKRLNKFLEDYTAMKPTRYSYADIKKITNDFKEKLGEGGYGNVFKGKVSNEIFVAVKLLHNSTENGEEFINEVGTMGTIHHVNVVRLLGFCADGFKRGLVYEFLPNGSLDKFIFPDGQEHHTFRMTRLHDIALGIALGIARGIEYLHQGCEQRILHFDIKPHNILLDENYNPKISDFGLAKLCEKGKSAVSMTAARGTMGYIAPEVFSRHFGNVTYKSDVYSFGMLLLEMVGRRKNIDTNVQNVSQVYFPEWVYGRLVNEQELRIQVEEDGEDQIAKKLAIVGLWCIQWNPVDRPSITSVLQMLQGSGENLSFPPNPFISGNAMNPVDSHEHGRPLNLALAVISESE